MKLKITHVTAFVSSLVAFNSAFAQPSIKERLDERKWNLPPRPDATKKLPAGQRDPWLWPFSEKSIWNMPIGSNAEFVHAGIGEAKKIGADLEIIHRVTPGAPERPIYDPGSLAQRASGQAVADPKRPKTMPIDDNVTFPDVNPPHTPNACAAFLHPDGRTVYHINPFCRPQAGGPIWGWLLPKTIVDLYGDGIEGSHGGSGLSTLGGSIRPGEMLGKVPLRHAIKINLWAKKYYAYNDDGTPGYRWPAWRSDKWAKQNYRGEVPELEMGALLAIPPTIKFDPRDKLITLERNRKIKLRTQQAIILFNTLQNYGAYIVDDADMDTHDFCIDSKADAEMFQVLKFSFSRPSKDFTEDVNNLMQILYVVKNNSAKSIGGGGTPRVALAPPLVEPAK